MAVSRQPLPLRERRTGRPCDERRHAKILRNTPGLEGVNFDDIEALHVFLC